MKRVRVYIVVLIFIPVVAVGAMFFITGPNGEPLMNMERLRQIFRREWSLVQKAGEKVVSVGEDTSQHLSSDDAERFDAPIESPQETLFKWRGKDGKWHFSNQLPPGREAFEIVNQE